MAYDVVADISVHCVYAAAMIPLFFLSWRNHWRWNGEKDVHRYRSMLVAVWSMFLYLIFKIGYDGDYFRYPNQNRHWITVSQAFLFFLESVVELSVGLVLLHTALSMLWNPDRTQQSQLYKVIKVSGYFLWGLMIAMCITADSLYAYDDSTVFFEIEHGDIIVAAYAIIIAFRWIYLIFASMFLPIVLLRSVASKRDTLSVLYYFMAIICMDIMAIIVATAYIVYLTGTLADSGLGASEAYLALAANAAYGTRWVAYGFLIIVALYLLTLLGRRQSQLKPNLQTTNHPEQSTLPSYNDQKPPVSELAHKSAISELDSKDVHAELEGGTQRAELDGEVVAELPGGPADGKKEKSRMSAIFDKIKF